MANGEVKAARYYYPPRMPLPLPVCFYNPTGYVCCNKQLNDLIVDTYTELEARPKFHTCNLNDIATMLQMKAEARFNTTFETIAGFEDFAQKIHFNGNLACKVEIGGK
uniref:Ground-like domain-containing protein n=1 Tax=Panagrolaimus superbus TaxID=310955 RepID=A0A914XV61_9BILA